MMYEIRAVNGRFGKSVASPFSMTFLYLCGLCLSCIFVVIFETLVYLLVRGCRSWAIQSFPYTNKIAFRLSAIPYSL